LVFCHSSDSKGFAAERVGQQVLQGVHLVPLTGLRCLNDTRLQPTHVLVDRFPWNGMPVHRDVGDSTSRRFRRHLQRPLNRFLKFSRSSTPQGSQRACAPGNVATHIRPATGRLSLFPTPLPAPSSVGLTASLPFFRKERYGLTTFRKVDKNGLGALCPPVALGVHDRVGMKPCARYSALFFWLKPVSTFGLSCITTFTKSSRMFTIPSIPPRLRLMLADTPSPRGSGASRMTVGTLSVGM